MELYTPILALALLATGFAVFSVVVSALTGPKRYNRAKLEIVFLYPWAVRFDAMAFYGLVEMVIFIATVFVAYIYVWRRGGLEWD